MVSQFNDFDRDLNFGNFLLTDFGIIIINLILV